MRRDLTQVGPCGNAAQTTARLPSHEAVLHWRQPLPRPPPALPSSPGNALTFRNVLITGTDEVWAMEGGEMD